MGAQSVKAWRREPLKPLEVEVEGLEFLFEAASPSGLDSYASQLDQSSSKDFSIVSTFF